MQTRVKTLPPPSCGGNNRLAAGFCFLETTVVSKRRYDMIWYKLQQHKHSAFPCLLFSDVVYNLPKCHKIHLSFFLPTRELFPAIPSRGWLRGIERFAVGSYALFSEQWTITPSDTRLSFLYSLSLSLWLSGIFSSVGRYGTARFYALMPFSVYVSSLQRPPSILVVK